VRILFFNFIIIIFLSLYIPKKLLSKTALVTISPDLKLFVQLAETKSEKKKGLMHFNKLEGIDGMLFNYKKPQIVNFWMKNTLIPLDIIFINNEGFVIAIKEGKPNSLKVISSKTPVSVVIEIPRGCAKELLIKEGSRIKWRIINKEKKKRYLHCLDHF
jgi:uncharacterized membrane protein (UPF0127 family)